MNPLKIFADNITPGSATTPGGVDTVAGGSDTLVDNVTNILNGVVAVLGLVCVVVIIIGGVNYMTSSGDAGKVKKAKETTYPKDGSFILDLEFDKASEYVNATVSDSFNTGLGAEDLLSIDSVTYPEKSVGKFLNSTRNSFKFKGEEYADLKAALEEGPVAFEFSFLQPVGNDGDLYFVGFDTLFNTFK